MLRRQIMSAARVLPHITPPPSMSEKRKLEPKENNKKGKRPRKFFKKATKAVKPGGKEETLQFEILNLLGESLVKEFESDKAKTFKEVVEAWGVGQEGKDVEVDIVALSAHGDGLGLLTPGRLICVPFSLPGEKVKAHVHSHERDMLLSHGDLLEIVTRSALREVSEPVPATDDPALQAVRDKFGARVQCKYFGRCSGCQYQPLGYDEQLRLKQDVVRNAFKNFSGLAPAAVPVVGPTLPSPLQYKYRTKLTPHFPTPRTDPDWKLTIGFEEKGRRRVIDIEECVIGTQVLNDALPAQRQKIQDTISSYKQGSTLLLRDSLPPRDAADPETHVCITDHHATVRERIGDLELEQKAGSFFQNNNAILPGLISHIGAAIEAVWEGSDSKKYLIDTYCGSGLFALTLARFFDTIKGVEIDKASVEWAKKNAKFNKDKGVITSEIDFIAGKAEAIFDDISFPADNTTIVLDPPRKGCDDKFLDQLLKFNPKMVVYISCNVHTQARDIGYLLNKNDKYSIKSVCAADLFANTHHAEGVAILQRE